jgi:uncharacterized membrane protein SpoIIM required for sporulation
LYRTATSDLAVARRDFPEHAVAQYLNGLVGRAYAAVYQRRASRRSAFVQFFLQDLPRTFRVTWPFTLVAFLMFFIPALISFVGSYRNPDDAALFVPGAERIIRDIRDQREWWQSINQEGRSVGAAQIATNNIQVTILAFAGGMLFGTLTFYVLVRNGLLLGSIAGAAQALDFADNLWGFVAAHGVVELSVIFIAGGAGLQLGWAMLRPGLLSRRDALTLAARRAGTLLLGGMLLLVIAGLIEGFISPSALPLWVKLTVAFGSGALLYSYLLLVGRERRVGGQ